LTAPYSPKLEMIMSEIKKNIETCRGEDVLAEVSAAPQDPHFGSLVNEAFDPMQQQALHQAGYDGYSEVIEQHKPYTFASTIIQMKSNLLLLLRALWQFPFGSGTLRSLSDMWQHYITRLSGNETYGIPSRLSSLTDLPSAPLLLADRKISGVPEAVDGISLVQLLFGDVRNTITELDDDNMPWTRSKNFDFSIFPNLQKLRLNWTKSQPPFSSSSALNDLSLPYMDEISGGSGCWIQNATMEELYLEGLVTVDWYGGSNNVCFYNLPNCKKLNFPNFVNVTKIGNCALVSDMPLLEEIYWPKFEGYGPTGYGGWPTLISSNCTNVKKIVFGTIKYAGTFTMNTKIGAGMPKLLHMEIGEGTAVNIDLSGWVPDSETLAHQDFLPNFRTYIALRLAAFDSNGPTLTLSQAVYDAIKDESHLFVFDEGTMTIYAYLTNIKHWTVTK